MGFKRKAFGLLFLAFFSLQTVYGFVHYISHSHSWGLNQEVAFHAEDEHEHDECQICSFFTAISSVLFQERVGIAGTVTQAYLTIFTHTIDIHNFIKGYSSRAPPQRSRF